MRAIVCSAFGPVGDLQLQDVQPAVPGPGQVRIRVHACGINFPDILLVEGKYQVKPPLPFFPGGEIAGVVTDVAPDVTGISPGQRVMAVIFWGGTAEEIVAPARALRPVPEHLDLLEAAVLQGGHVTVLHALRQRARLQAGETLLVLGAAGGIGLAAVQLGKALGAHVIAAVGSAEKAACALGHGADAVIEYTVQDLKGEVKRLTDGRGADVILDPVGGDVFDAAMRCIARNGRLLVVGFTSGRIPQLPVNLVLLKNCAVVGVNYQDFERSEPEAVEENYRELQALIARCGIRPRIDRVYPLERAAEALAYVGERRAMGKVVVDLRG